MKFLSRVNLLPAHDPGTWVLIPLTVVHVIAIVCFTFYNVNYRSDPDSCLLLSEHLVHMIFGWFCWTFMEYWFHRIVNHGPFTLSWEDHDFHHKFPDDPDEYVYEFTESIPLCAGFGLSARYLARFPPQIALAMMTGFMTGYLSYEWLHVGSHVDQKKCLWWQVWWAMPHRRHHYGHPNKNYGFVTPLWDIIFGTFAPHKNYEVKAPS